MLLDLVSSLGILLLVVLLPPLENLLQILNDLLTALGFPGNEVERRCCLRGMNCEVDEFEAVKMSTLRKLTAHCQPIEEPVHVELLQDLNLLKHSACLLRIAKCGRLVRVLKLIIHVVVHWAFAS